MSQFIRSIRTRIAAAVERETERGQMLVLAAFALIPILGLVGMSVDVGLLVYTKADLQKLADSAALAGGQDLPNTSAATSMAMLYGGKSAVFGTTTSVDFSNTYGANDTIAVTSAREVHFVFLSILGIADKNVTASAKVRRTGYSGGNGLLPFGFIASNNDHSTLLQNSCYLGQTGGVPQFKQNTQCTLKYGAGTNSGGDFGAVSLDGTGASTYSNAITNGSTKTFKVGDKIQSETGNMVGPTDSGIDARFSRPAPASCPGNNRSDVLITSPTDGSVSIRPGCENSPRIGIIPVVDKIANPELSTILGFAFVFLTGTNGNGGHTQLKAEFVKFTTELPGGVYGANGSPDATATRLVE